MEKWRDGKMKLNKFTHISLLNNDAKFKKKKKKKVTNNHTKEKKKQSPKIFYKNKKHVPKKITSSKNKNKLSCPSPKKSKEKEKRKKSDNCQRDCLEKNKEKKKGNGFAQGRDERKKKCNLN